MGSIFDYHLQFGANVIQAKMYWNLPIQVNDKDHKDHYGPEPKRIIFNGPATIVFWKDGTKTVVKCADMEEYNRYNAFCAALAKKIFGTNSKINRIVKSGVEN